MTSAPGTGTGEALFNEGRRAALELRVESRGEAAARAVAPRDKVGDTVWEGGEDTRFDADGLDLDDVVAMSCQSVKLVESYADGRTVTRLR